MARNPKSDRRRHQFAQAARRTMSRKGSFNVTIRDVAREAGVSPGAILYHYPDFDAVLVAAWQNLSDEISRQGRYILEMPCGTARRLATAIHHGVPRGPDDERYVLYGAIGRYRANPALNALARAGTHRQIALVQTLLEVGAADGTFTLGDRSLTIARTIVGLQHGLGIWIVNEDPEVDFAEGERLARVYAERLTGATLPDPMEIPVELAA